MNCLVCKQDSHRHACNQCITQTRRWLRELELYTTWLHMPAMLAPHRGTTGRRQPGYGSRPPARIEALVVLDRRSHTNPIPLNTTLGLGLDNEDNPLWPILGTLHGLATFIRQTADHSKPRQVTVAGELGYLLAHIDWCANQPWIDDVIADIHDLHTQARGLAYDRPEALATCLGDLIRKVECDGKVFWVQARDKAGQPMDKARCVACGRIYTGFDLVRLVVNEEVAG